MGRGRKGLLITINNKTRQPRNTILKGIHFWSNLCPNQKENTYIYCGQDPELLKIAEKLTPQQLADLIPTN